ncbi:hypothetical protein R0131_18160 [Clostridium sp. AL.422]|uniref:hypothetical protein n=1 Tax=Clostridium TaxID=1485 RepID=UPI00293DC3FE|nr:MULTISPECIES: hypothetical protein [unclassified Clostridium]MDV4152757.1 hypothetical protein [Clostridium sp. AL.422]
MKNNFTDLSNVGNFTKLSVKRFEENIVNKTNYLESVAKNRLGQEYTFEEDKNE